MTPEQQYNAALGASLKAHRVGLSLSQRQLCKVSGVARMTLGRIEGGEQSPTVRTLYRLAHALGVGTRDLLPDEPPVTAEQIGLAEASEPDE